MINATLTSHQDPASLTGTQNQAPRSLYAFNTTLCHNAPFDVEIAEPLQVVATEMQNRAENFWYGLGAGIRNALDNISIGYKAIRDANTPFHSAVLALDKDDLTDVRCSKSLINQLNANGESPLKMAITLKRESIIKPLLAKGAHVDEALFLYAIESQLSIPVLKLLFIASPHHKKDLPTDHLLVLMAIKGHTKARNILLKKATKVIVDCYQVNGREIRKFSEFTFQKMMVRSRYSGQTSLGMFRDLQGEDWWLKNSGSREYLADAVLSLLLAENVPVTDIILNDKTGGILSASKNIAGFTDLHNLETQSPGLYNTFPFTFNGKPIRGFLETMCAIVFIGDIDVHIGNIGLIEHDSYYTLGKIDHDFSFASRPGNGHSLAANLDNLKYLLRYQTRSLEELGFNTVYEAILKIATFNFALIEKAFNERAEKIKILYELIEFSHLNVFFYRWGDKNLLQEFLDVQEWSLEYLRLRHKQFFAMVNTMRLEKAIMEHDSETLRSLYEAGLSGELPFKSFFGRDYASEDVTGRILANKYWPDLLNHSIFGKTSNSVHEELALAPASITPLYKCKLDDAEEFECKAANATIISKKATP